jgi:hypothetical protein
VPSRFQQQGMVPLMPLAMPRDPMYLVIAPSYSEGVDWFRANGLDERKHFLYAATARDTNRLRGIRLTYPDWIVWTSPHRTNLDSEAREEIAVIQKHLDGTIPVGARRTELAGGKEFNFVWDGGHWLSEADWDAMPEVDLTIREVPPIQPCEHGMSSSLWCDECRKKKPRGVKGGGSKVVRMRAQRR